MTTVTPPVSIQNPFQQLISACEDDPNLIQARYEAHRSARNAQYKSKILDVDFPGWSVDEILKKLTSSNSSADGQFIDTRHNLSFWARPPRHIRDLVDEIQQEIRAIAPTLWFTPLECLHMTTLEIVNSRTPSEVDAIASSLEQTGVLPDIVNYTLDHRARLIKPMVSYDAAAMALSFVPAAGDDDQYTYHHLRRDLFDKVTATGVEAAARYTVPSAHVTIARFTSQDGVSLGDPGHGSGRVDHGRVAALIGKIEDINQKLQLKCWPREDGETPSGGEWVVGQEKGLDFCKGASWYGKGERVLAGKGF